MKIQKKISASIQFRTEPFDWPHERNEKKIIRLSGLCVAKSGSRARSMFAINWTEKKQQQQQQKACIRIYFVPIH